MRIWAISLGLAAALLCAGSGVLAQQAAQSADPPSPSVASSGVLIPKGTRISLRLAERLDPTTAQVGQAIRLVAGAPVRIGDSVVVARGALAEGHIEYIKPARRLSRSSEIGIRVDWVQSVADEPVWLHSLKRAKGPSPGSVAQSRTGIAIPDDSIPSTAPPEGAGAYVITEAVITSLVMILGKGENVPVAPGLRVLAATDEDFGLDLAKVRQAQERFPDPGGRTLLHIYRPDDPMPYQPTVYCQGKKMVRLGKLRVFTVELPAGEYECRANQQKPVKLKLYGGDEYFLRVKFRSTPTEGGSLAGWFLGVSAYWDVELAEATEGEDVAALSQSAEKKHIYLHEPLQPAPQHP